MPAFLEYFNTFRWLHRDHTLDRISSLFARFDQTIKDETGLTSQQMQDMVFWVEEQCQSSLGRIGAHKQAADKERERFLIEAEAQKLNVEEMRSSKDTGRPCSLRTSALHRSLQQHVLDRSIGISE